MSISIDEYCKNIKNYLGLVFNIFSGHSLICLGNSFWLNLIQEVDLLLNDGSKHINVVGWRKNATLPQRVETSRRRSRRCLLMSLALAKTSAQQVSHSSIIYQYAVSFFFFFKDRGGGDVTRCRSHHRLLNGIILV
jgi:hypothetical protein